ncbi:MAG: ABC transporter permease [Rectinemataceae bacterium]|nr:ABC transporter permease [Rectinemataceae bacterium]
MNALHIPALSATVDIMTPLLLAAIGGLYSSLAGVLNIALEGLMVFSAFFSVVFTVATGSLFLGILGGICTTLLLTILFGSVALGLRANIFICGLATNLLAAALSLVLSFSFYGRTGSVSFPDMPILSPLRFPFLEGIPIFGDILANHNALVYASWILLALTGIIVYRTPFGMRLRAVGFTPKAAFALGINPKRYQFAALLMSGFACALAGSMLTLTLGAFVPNISSGRGWIALVIIYLGRRTPVGILLGSIIFGFVEFLSNYLQVVSSIPSGLLLAMPFFVTVIALVVYSLIENGTRKTIPMSFRKGGKVR